VGIVTGDKSSATLPKRAITAESKSLLFMTFSFTEKQVPRSRSMFKRTVHDRVRRRGKRGSKEANYAPANPVRQFFLWGEENMPTNVISQ
jgi:hypothetical protein